MTQEFKDHIVQYPNRFKRVPVAGKTDEFDMIPTWMENPSEVVQVGTPIDRQLFEGITSQLADIAISVESFPLVIPETDDTARVQRAVNHLRDLGGGRLVFTKPLYQIKQVEIFSDITFYSNKGSVIKSIDAGVSEDHAMFYSKWALRNLSNVAFKGLTFDGNRSNISYPYFNIIGIWVHEMYKLTNFEVTGCKFIDAKQDFIKIVGKDVGSKADQINVSNNKFYGVDSTNLNYPGNALRVTLNAYTYANYGYVFATNVTAKNNYAEKIRTLADLKRGCANFIVSENTTKNMHDCNHSVDGSFYGQIVNNIGKMDSGFTPATGVNFVEVQGENIVIDSNVIEYQKIIGIQVTDYGSTQEGTNVGHQSKNITVSNNTIKKTDNLGIKCANVKGLKVVNNTIGESVIPLVIESGLARENDAGIQWTADDTYVSGNQFGTYTQGIVLAGTNLKLGAGNADAKGALLINYASSAKDFTVLSQADELNFNTSLEIDPSTTRIKYWNSGELNRVTAATSPLGALRAVTIEDTNTGSLGTIENTDFKIPVKKDDVLHLGIFTKRNTANACGVVINEYQDNTFLRNSFHAFSNAPEWTRNRIAVKVENANCNNVRIGLIPASSSNSPSNVGKTDIAKLNISKHPLN